MTSRKVRHVTALHQPALRWSLLAVPVAGALVLAGCSGSAGNDDGGSTEDPDADAASRSWSPQANDADDFYAQIARQYSEETGIEIEVIPYPSDAYNTQVTTQLQAGNAADMMILSPGTGQPISVITLAEAGFLEPLDETSAGILPAGSEAQFQIDGDTFAQPTALDPRRHGLQRDRGRRGRHRRYPETYEDLLDGLHRRTRRRQDASRSSPAASRSTPACSPCSSRRPASTRRRPTGTSSGQQAMSPSPTAAGRTSSRTSSR